MPRLTPPPKKVGQQQNKVYPTVRKQRIVVSLSTAGNLHILLADVIGRWANSQFPGKMRFKFLGRVKRVIHNCSIPATQAH